MHLVHIWRSCNVRFSLVNSVMYRTYHAFPTLKNTVEVLRELN